MTDNPFEKVLDRLREKGWTQGSFTSFNGGHCIYGAAHSLEESGSLARRIDPLIKAVVAEHYPERLTFTKHRGVEFNDHPDTTFSDVERVLEKAAVKWEEERVLRDD